MNPEKQQPQITEQEGLEIQKEVFMTSGGLKVGQSMAEYKAEREGIWDRMHPEKKEEVETQADNTEPVQDNKEADEEWERNVKASEAKRQEDLKRVRQELGLESPPEQIKPTDTTQTEGGESLKNPRINYIEVVIDDDYMRKNLVPNGGLRMKSGQANWKGEVDLMQYVISKDLSPEYRQIATEKIEKLKAGQEKMYKHESHHIQNRENELTPHLAAKNLREFLAFRVLDEMSAFTTGELDNQDMTAENILQALRSAEKSITDSYYGQPFSDDASWYMSQHNNEPEALSRKIDQERYHKIMRQYFTINGQDALSVLQKDNKMSEFAEITNRLIIKLDSLLEARKTPQGQKVNSGIESPENTEKVENKERSIEGIKDEDYENFRVKNGETDVGAFWYEYYNVASRKLKESGKLEWGKERIYFDIPVDQMEKLRDLVFAVAKKEKIAIAFKHLDVEKSHELNLQADSEATRFVTNFASVEDAKRFYQALQQQEEYNGMKSDRNLNYDGFNIDGIAHYASGYREARASLKNIIESAQLSPDGTYSYTAMIEDYDGKKKPVNKTMTKDTLDGFKKQYDAMPDPENLWSNAK